MEARDHHAWSLTHFEIYKATTDSVWEEKPDPEAAQRRALSWPAPGAPSQSSLGPCMSTLVEALSAEALNEATGDHVLPGHASLPHSLPLYCTHWGHMWLVRASSFQNSTFVYLFVVSFLSLCKPTSGKISSVFSTVPANLKTLPGM